jgi:hypothetical protein
MEGVDIGFGGGVVEPRLHQQLLELAASGDPCALLALVLGDDDIALGVAEAALGRGIGGRARSASVVLS